MAPDPPEDTTAALRFNQDNAGGAQDGNALRNIYAEIDRLEKSNIKTVEYMDYSE